MLDFFAFVSTFLVRFFGHLELVRPKRRGLAMLFERMSFVDILWAATLLLAGLLVYEVSRLPCPDAKSYREPRMM